MVNFIWYSKDQMLICKEVDKIVDILLLLIELSYAQANSKLIIVGNMRPGPRVLISYTISFEIEGVGE